MPSSVKVLMGHKSGSVEQELEISLEFRCQGQRFRFEDQLHRDETVNLGRSLKEGKQQTQENVKKVKMDIFTKNNENITARK